MERTPTRTGSFCFLKRQTNLNPIILRIALLFWGFFLLFPLVGCKNSVDDTSLEVNTFPSSSETEKKEKKISSQPTDLPIDLLGETTDRFVESYADGTEKLPDQDRALMISEEIREKYTEHADTFYSPELEGNDTTPIVDDAPHYQLSYRFEPDSTEYWAVSHQLWKETSYGGMTRKIETVSKIVRSWKIHADGQSSDTLPTYSVQYSIDQMRLEQKEEGEEPVSYDSQTDSVVPEEFRRFGTEKMIGVPLEEFRIDSLGRMTEKNIVVEGFESDAQDSRVTVPFPSEPVAVGQSWTLPCSFYLKAKDGTVKTIKGVQRFCLENVTDNLATIKISMTVLSLVNDSYLEGQLAEKVCEGICRFDIENGRVLRTELNFSRTVPNAYGEATILVYRCRITEERLTDISVNE